MSTMANLERLTKEINRIIAAPYAVSLKALYDIAIQVEVKDLQTWASAKTCQVQSLAIRLHEGYGKWPFVTQLISAFARVAQFRDALLHHFPAFLDHVLSQRIVVQDSNSLKAPLGVILLSYPLPDGMALPESFLDYLHLLVDQMSENATSSTIGHVYEVLCGLGAKTFELLPDSLLTRLAAQCRSWIQKLDEHISSTLCIAICAHFNRRSTPKSTPSSGSFSSNDKSPVRQKDWYISITHIFSERFITKTLDLLVLRMILFCSNSRDLAQQEAISGIRLATKIADTIEPDQIDAYLTKSPQKFAKLQGKLVGQSDKDIKVEALSFCVVFAGTGRLSAQCKDFMQDPETAVNLHLCCPLAFERSILSDNTHGKEMQLRGHRTASLVSLIPFLIDLCRPAQHISLNTARVIEAANGICDVMLSTIQTSVDLRQEVAAILGAAGVPDWWDFDPFIFSSASGLETNCLAMLLCQTSVGNLRRSLGLRLSRIFLTVGWLSPMSPIRSQDMLTVNKLMNRLQQGESISHGLAHDNGSSRIQQDYKTLPHSHGEADNISQQWKSCLGRLLSANASSTERKVIEFMEHVCQDLERRCEHVEGPLRSAEASILSLKEELEASKKRARDTEHELATEREKSARLTDRNSLLEKQNTESGARHQDLLQQVKVLRQQIDDLREQNHIIERAAKDNAACQELDHKMALEKLQVTLHKEKDNVCLLEENLLHASTNTGRLERALLDLKTESEQQEKRFQDEVSRVQREAEEDSKSLQLKLQSQSEAHLDELNDLRREATAAIEVVQEASEAHTKERDGLLEKIRRLRKEKSHLTKDLNNASELRTKLTALMGGDPTQNQGAAFDLSDSESSVDGGDNNATSTTLAPGQTPGPIRNSPDNRHHVRTPKRVSHVDARKSLPRAKAQIASRSDRRALGSISPNKSRSSSIPKRSDVYVGRSALQENVQLGKPFDPDHLNDIESFDDNDLATSTGPKCFDHKATTGEDTEFTVTDL